MKKLLFVLSVLISLNSYAQDLMGFHSSNYAGVYSLGFNPAEIGDSRYKFHMNVIGTNFRVFNNYIWIKSEKLTDFSNISTNFATDSMFRKNSGERLNGNDKEVHLFNKINGPLSFMFTINSKNAIAFSYNINTLINVDGVSEQLAQFAYNNKDPKHYVLSNNNYFNTNNSMWVDVGLTYSREILNTGKHHLRAAITAKYNKGLANMFIFGKDAVVSVKNADSLNYVNGTFSAGSSVIPGIDQPYTDFNNMIDQILRNSGSGWGTDFGLVYEHRDKIEDYKYQMDCKERVMNNKNKYKFKLGFAVTDLGYVKYKRNVNDIHSGFFADSSKAKNIDLDIFKSVQDGVKALEDSLRTVNMFLYPIQDSFYNILTPTRINIYGDYRFHKWFYVNFTASISPWRRNGNATSHHVTEFSITPRFEMKWLSLFVPMSTNHSGQFKLGTGLRLGPLVLGSNDILPFLASGKEVYGGDFYMNLSLPIFRKGKARDKDKDGVSNRKDKCKELPGPCESGGCPEGDKDNDSIPDRLDKCPDEKGVREFEGCPDRDGDKVMDKLDKCPDVAGVVELQGCPDRDKDGIVDSADRCPDIAGIPEFKGCPDTDKDGLPDEDDACPTEAGPRESKGCPDKDGDGVIDKQDKCIDRAGPNDNFGCPYDDQDNDGLLDKDDDCPKVPGPKENRGCPKPVVKEVIKEVVKETVKVEDQKVIDLVFENLEFHTNKDVIKTTSYPSLDNLVKILNKKKSFKLRLMGHTDNVGKPELNKILSEKRALAVKRYLVGRGINASMITTEGYGDTVPIADNNSEDGRQKNRRVELKLE